MSNSLLNESGMCWLNCCNRKLENDNVRSCVSNVSAFLPNKNSLAMCIAYIFRNEARRTKQNKKKCSALNMKQTSVHAHEQHYDWHIW